MVATDAPPGAARCGGLETDIAKTPSVSSASAPPAWEWPRAALPDLVTPQLRIRAARVPSWPTAARPPLRPRPRVPRPHDRLHERPHRFPGGAALPPRIADPRSDSRINSRRRGDPEPVAAAVERPLYPPTSATVAGNSGQGLQARRGSKARHLTGKRGSGPPWRRGVSPVTSATAVPVTH